jgi:hypothetical protein
MDQERNKNLDIINLLQNLKENVILRESAEDIDYSSLSDNDLKNKLDGLRIKSHYFTDPLVKSNARKSIEALEKELQKREASGEVKEAKKVAFEDTEIETWFERDRKHVELRYKDAGETIMEWWDEAVAEAVEDGFLDPKNYHQSAYNYAISLGKIEEATKVPQTMQPKDKLEDDPESVCMKDGEVSDKSKDREDVIKEIPDKDLEKLPTQEKKQLMLCNSCCKVFRSNENVCIHCKSTLVESISSSVSKTCKDIQKDSKVKEGKGEEIFQEAVNFTENEIARQMKSGWSYKEEEVLNLLIRKFGVTGSEAKEILLKAVGEDGLDLGDVPSFESKLKKQSDPGWQATFDEWKKDVDRALVKICGAPSDDIDDWTYADDFDAGIFPEKSARRAIQNAKKGSGFESKSKVKEHLNADGSGDTDDIDDVKRQERNIELKTRFDREKKEHPSFTNDQIWQIVKDHMKESESKVNEGKVNIAEIVEHLSNELKAAEKDKTRSEFWLNGLRYAIDIVRQYAHIGNESKVNEVDSEQWSVFSNSKYGKNRISKWFNLKEEANNFKKGTNNSYKIGNVEYTYEVISSKDVREKNESVKEAENTDTLQIVSRGIVDKATAEKLATEQKGMVVADDKDKSKFMVIRKKE